MYITRRPWSIEDKVEVIFQCRQLLEKNQKNIGTAEYIGTKTRLLTPIAEKFNRSVSSVISLMHRVEVGQDPNSSLILKRIEQKRINQMSLFDQEKEIDQSLHMHTGSSQDPEMDKLLNVSPQPSPPGPYPVVEEELFGDKIARKELIGVIIHFDGTGDYKYDDCDYYNDSYKSYIKAIVEAYLLSGRNYRVLSPIISGGDKTGVPVLLDTVWKVWIEPDSTPYFVRKDISVPRDV